MNVVELTDRAEIEALLRRDIGRHLYALGDLDDFFWPSTRWWGWRTEAGEIDAILLLFSGLAVPTLIAQGVDVASLRSLVRELLDASALPGRFFAHLAPGVEDVFAGFTLTVEGLHHRMMLVDRAKVLNVSIEGTRHITQDDLPAITQFYAESYPGNWFSARMLQTGQYVGVMQGGDWVSVAGVHVYAPGLGVAALGNIATHPQGRGQGFGKRAVAALCRSLLDAGVEHIGLNVKATNSAAIRLYERLGFEVVSSHGEFLISPSAPEPTN